MTPEHRKQLHTLIAVIQENAYEDRQDVIELYREGVLTEDDMRLLEHLLLALDRVLEVSENTIDRLAHEETTHD
jgi:hypothetical protein